VLAICLATLAFPIKFILVSLFVLLMVRTLQSKAMPRISRIKYLHGQWLIDRNNNDDEVIDIMHCQLWSWLIRISFKDSTGRKKHTLLFSDHCDDDEWRQLSVALRLMPLQSE